jgi:thioredoxin reductase
MTDKYDVVILGAGTAGLSAALSLGRAMRRTLVLDGGPPRNAPSEHAHNLFTRDGTPPDELLRLGKRDLEKYETIEVREGVATGATGADGEFEVTLDGGEAVSARKIVIATGLSDVMPDIPGFAEAWGRGIYYCPFCHGWEVRGRPLAVYGSGDMVMFRVALIRNWSRDLIAITDGTEVPEEIRRKLDALGVPLHESPISRVESDGEGLARVVLEDGTEIEREGLFTNPALEQRSGVAETLGCETEYMEMMRAEVISITPGTFETTVKGVFVAGDAGKMMQSLANAVASGCSVGAFVTHELAAADVEAEVAAISA